MAKEKKEEEETVDFIQKGKMARKNKNGQQRNGSRQDNEQYRKAEKGFRRKCSRCGLNHEPRNCPAFGSECHVCHKLNHYARMCLMKPENSSGKAKNVNAVGEGGESSDDNDHYLDLGELTVDTMNVSHIEWLQKIKVGERYIDFKLDTGAQVNIIPKAVLIQNGPVRVKKYKHCQYVYG